MRYIRLIAGNTWRWREGVGVELLEVEEAGAGEEGVFQVKNSAFKCKC